MLSTTSDSSWKIGKSDTYIKAVSAKMSALPAGVFDGFYIDDAKTKKISTVDFALMTYDMAPADRKSLMELYGIHSDTISEILNVANEIAAVDDEDPTITDNQLKEPFSTQKKVNKETVEF